MKTLTTITATRRPGRCARCRHANQGTRDFEEGRVLCGIDGQRKSGADKCSVRRLLPNRLPIVVDEMRAYWLYAPWTGSNGTFGKLEDLRIVAEDATRALREGSSRSVDVPALKVRSR